MRRSSSSGARALFPMIALGSLACAAPPPASIECRVERAGPDVIREQIDEAIRAEDPNWGPLLPATYRYLIRLDRDLGILGLEDDELEAEPDERESWGGWLVSPFWGRE